jgi:hypothetical protein
VSAGLAALAAPYPACRVIGREAGWRPVHPVRVIKDRKRRSSTLRTVKTRAKKELGDENRYSELMKDLPARARRQTPRNSRHVTLIDADVRVASAIGAVVALYRHPRLSAMKLACDPNNPVRFKEDATADELRAEVMRRLSLLAASGVIDLQALPTPDELANPGVQSGINGE